MAIHGKQLKNASIDLSKLEGIAASPAADKLLLSAATGAAQLLSVGGDLQASVSGTTLDLQIVDGTVTFANLTDAAVIKESEGIQSNDNDTTIPTSAAVKNYVDAQVSASGSALELTAGTGSASIALATETLSFVGGSNISTVANSTLNSLTVNLDSHISLASATLSGALSVGGNAVITGDLTVQGTTTTVNSTVVEIADPTFRLAAGTSTPATLNAASAGIVFGEDAAGISFALDAGGDFASTQSIDLASGEVYKIGNADVLSVDGAAKVQSAVAGDGLAHSAGVLSLDLNELTVTTVDVANDSIAIIDADDNSSKKQSVSGLAAAMAGTGITATNGVLSVASASLKVVSITPSNSLTAANLIIENGQSGAYTLPSSPSGQLQLSVNGVIQELGAATGQGDYYVNSSDQIEWNSPDFDLDNTDTLVFTYIPA